MIERVRARMSVQVVEKTPWSEITKFQAVTGGPGSGKEENSFASATPAGKLELTVDNKAVHGFFVPGQDYYIDITPVPPKAPAQ